MPKFPNQRMRTLGSAGSNSWAQLSEGATRTSQEEFKANIGAICSGIWIDKEKGVSSYSGVMPQNCLYHSLSMKTAGLIFFLNQVLW